MSGVWNERDLSWTLIIQPAWNGSFDSTSRCSSIVGLMSVMPAALEMPMAEILEQITVSPEVREALECRGGQLGQLLELVEHYDNSNVDGAATMLARMGGKLGHQTLNLCLSEAIAWMMSLGDD